MEHDFMDLGFYWEDLSEKKTKISISAVNDGYFSINRSFAKRFHGISNLNDSKMDNIPNLYSEKEVEREIEEEKKEVKKINDKFTKELEKVDEKVLKWKDDHIKKMEKYNLLSNEYISTLNERKKSLKEYKTLLKNKLLQNIPIKIAKKTVFSKLIENCIDSFEIIFSFFCDFEIAQILLLNWGFYTYVCNRVPLNLFIGSLYKREHININDSDVNFNSFETFYKKFSRGFRSLTVQSNLKYGGYGFANRILQFILGNESSFRNVKRISFLPEFSKLKYLPRMVNRVLGDKSDYPSNNTVHNLDEMLIRSCKFLENVSQSVFFKVKGDNLKNVRVLDCVVLPISFVNHLNNLEILKFDFLATFYRNFKSFEKEKFTIFSLCKFLEDQVGNGKLKSLTIHALDRGESHKFLRKPGEYYYDEEYEDYDEDEDDACKKRIVDWRKLIDDFINHFKTLLHSIVKLDLLKKLKICFFFYLEEDSQGLKKSLLQFLSRNTSMEMLGLIFNEIEGFIVVENELSKSETLLQKNKAFSNDFKKHILRYKGRTKKVKDLIVDFLMCVSSKKLKKLKLIYGISLEKSFLHVSFEVFRTIMCSPSIESIYFPYLSAISFGIYKIIRSSTVSINSKIRKFTYKLQNNSKNKIAMKEVLKIIQFLLTKTNVKEIEIYGFKISKKNKFKNLDMLFQMIVYFGKNLESLVLNCIPSSLNRYRFHICNSIHLMNVISRVLKSSHLKVLLLELDKHVTYSPSKVRKQNKKEVEDSSKLLCDELRSNKFLKKLKIFGISWQNKINEILKSRTNSISSNTVSVQSKKNIIVKKRKLN